MKIYKIITNFLLSIVLAMLSVASLGAVAPPVAATINPIYLGSAIYGLQIVYHAFSIGGLSLVRDITLNDTSYEGDILRQFISYATTRFETLQKGCINVLGGIKKKRRVPTLKVDNFIQARNETPISAQSGGLTIGARELEPQDFMGYLEFNPRDLEQHALAVELDPKLLDAELPQTLESAVLQEILKLNGNYFDKAVWRSVKDDAAIATAQANGLGTGDNNLIFIDGLEKKIFDDSDVYKTGSPSAMTPANIVPKFEDLAANIDQSVYDDPAFKWMLSGSDRQTYRNAQAAQTNKGIDFTQGGVMEFDGRPIVTINGMSAGSLVAGKASMDMSSNFWMGVNETDEEQYLKMMQLANNSELWFIKMLCKMDVNYGLSGEIAAHILEDYS